MNRSNIRVMAEAYAAIMATGRLADGWNYGRGTHSTAGTRSRAMLLVSLLTTAGADDIAVFPDTDGGIMITGYKGGRSAEILACPDGAFELMFETDLTETEIERLADFTKLRDRMGEEGWQEKSTSASFHQNIMTFESGDIIGSPSKTRLAAVSQSSMWIAPSSPRVTFAATSDGSTLDVFTAPRQLSGGSLTQKFRQESPSSNRPHRQAISAITT